MYTQRQGADDIVRPERKEGRVERHGGLRGRDDFPRHRGAGTIRRHIREHRRIFRECLLLRIQVDRRREAYLSAGRFAAVNMRIHARDRRQIVFGHIDVVDHRPAREALLGPGLDVGAHDAFRHLARDELHLHPVLGGASGELTGAAAELPLAVRTVAVEIDAHALRGRVALGDDIRSLYEGGHVVPLAGLEFHQLLRTSLLLILLFGTFEDESAGSVVAGAFAMPVRVTAPAHRIAALARLLETGVDQLHRRPGEDGRAHRAHRRHDNCFSHHVLIFLSNLQHETRRRAGSPRCRARQTTARCADSADGRAAARPWTRRRPPCPPVRPGDSLSHGGSS